MVGDIAVTSNVSFTDSDGDRGMEAVFCDDSDTMEGDGEETKGSDCGVDASDTGSKDEEIIFFNLIRSPNKGAISRRYSSSSCKKMSPVILCLLMFSKTSESTSGTSSCSRQQRPFKSLSFTCSITDDGRKKSREWLLSAIISYYHRV